MRKGSVSSDAELESRSLYTLYIYILKYMYKLNVFLHETAKDHHDLLLLVILWRKAEGKAYYFYFLCHSNSTLLF